MKKPSWSYGNLKRHHEVHPINECACWEKLTGIKPGPISIQSYESESLSVVQNCWLYFRGLHQGSFGSEASEVEYFCDVRKCLTAVHFESQKIKTCFHVHSNGDCEIPTSLRSKLQLLQYFLRKKSAREGRISNAKDVKCVATAKELEALRTFIEELKQPARTLGHRR